MRATPPTRTPLCNGRSPTPRVTHQAAEAGPSPRADAYIGSTIRWSLTSPFLLEQ